MMKMRAFVTSNMCAPPQATSTTMCLPIERSNRGVLELFSAISIGIGQKKIIVRKRSFCKKQIVGVLREGRPSSRKRALPHTKTFPSSVSTMEVPMPHATFTALCPSKSLTSCGVKG